MNLYDIVQIYMYSCTCTLYIMDSSGIGAVADLARTQPVVNLLVNAGTVGCRSCPSEPPPVYMHMYMYTYKHTCIRTLVNIHITQHASIAK